MKKGLTWFLLFQKRILKKPMFQATLILIPIILILLTSFQHGDASLIKVALYKGNGDLSSLIAEHMLDRNNSVIQFYECDSEEKVRQDVIRGKAECGYLIPDNLEEKITSNNSLITVLNKDSSISTMVINELLCGEMFSHNSYKIFEEFMLEHHPDILSSSKERSDLKDMFEKYRSPQMMFSFQYIDGQENVLLNHDSNANYYMMPVRGILSVLILVAAMGGVLMLSKDDKKGTWQWIKLHNRPLFHYVYLIMTIFIVCLVSLIAIFFTGLNTYFILEIFLMICYAILIAGFCNLLRVLIPNTYVLCSVIPILVLISLVISPVFIDLRRMIPEINILRLLIPSNYYLYAIYGIDMQFKLLLSGIVFSASGIAIDYYKLRKI